MDNNLNNNQQDSTQNNQSLDIFTRPMPTGNEPVSLEPTEVVTPVETVVETPVIPETGSEPVSVEPTEVVTPVETVVETPVIPETGSEPVSVEPTEVVTPTETVVETPVVSETGSEPVSVEPTEAVTPVETVVETPVIPETGSEPVSVEPTEVVTPTETVVETPVIPETGSEPVSVEPTEVVTPTETVVETPVIPETGSEPVSVEPTEAVTPVETVVETPVIPETGSEPVNVQTVEPTKKSNKGLVTIIVIILLTLVGVGIYFFLNKDNKEEGNEQSSSSVKKENSKYECINGIYKNGDTQIKIYCTDTYGIDGSKIQAVAYSVEKEGENQYLGVNFTKSPFYNNKASLFDESLWFEKGKLNYENEDDNTSIVLDKVSDYTKEEYFKEAYNANTSLFDGKLNAVYKLGSSKIVIYPISDKELFFYYSDLKNKKAADEINYSIGMSAGSSNGSKYLNASLEKKDDGSYEYYTDSFNKITKLSLKFNGDNITVNYETTEEDNKFETLNGEYAKTKELTIDDYIDNKFE